MFSASPDQTIRVWGIQPKGCAQVIRAHDGPVSGISLHATGDYLLSSGMDAVSTEYIYCRSAKSLFQFDHFLISTHLDISAESNIINWVLCEN